MKPVCKFSFDDERTERKSASAYWKKNVPFFFTEKNVSFFHGEECFLFLSGEK